MFTSNYAVSGNDPKAVAISRGKPWWFRGRAYDALAPTREMLARWRADFAAGKEDEAHTAFDAAYGAQLAQLDPAQVVADLGDGAIVLCWENFNVRCHRRLVAEWLERALAIEIPEVGHLRKDSIPYELQRSKPKSRNARCRMPVAESLLSGTRKCFGCGKYFSFNPELVPSIRVNSQGRPDPRGVRQPICRTCVERVNPKRITNGLPPIVIPEGAYELA